jgi:hypothetical protein
MQAFGGLGLLVTSLVELRAALPAAISAALGSGVPALVDAVLDPMAGVESGNVHSFNVPKSKL